MSDRKPSICSVCYRKVDLREVDGKWVAFENGDRHECGSKR